MTPRAVLTDEMWALVEPLMPSSDGKRGRPFRDHRQVVEGIIYLTKSDAEFQQTYVVQGKDWF